MSQPNPEITGSTRIVTVSRQLGAGGAAVATRLADLLGWRLLDRALVEKIAEELKVAPEQVEPHDERVESFVERLGQYLSEGYPEILPIPMLPPVSPDRTARAARRIVTAALDESPAVIVGHGAQCVLRDDPRAFHVLLFAPLEVRIQRATVRYGVDEETAAERIRESDANRRAYIREHFDREWLDPRVYHLSIDTGRVAMEKAAELIELAIREGLG
ncbi:MAG TPA: cytidylate kinase-like family protein [Longimicrobiaceae bacterium]|nr:cytidylate kinase-like family protein [Longimicrobiaceae bacterium]